MELQKIKFGNDNDEFDMEAISIKFDEFKNKYKDEKFDSIYLSDFDGRVIRINKNNSKDIISPKKEN